MRRRAWLQEGGVSCSIQIQAEARGAFFKRSTLPRRRRHSPERPRPIARARAAALAVCRLNREARGWRAGS